MGMNLPERPTSDIGAFLRHVRNTLDLNLRDAAKAAGVSFTYLGEVERGERAPSEAWLLAYIKHLGMIAADSRGRAA